MPTNEIIVLVDCNDAGEDMFTNLQYKKKTYLLLDRTRNSSLAQEYEKNQI